MPDGAIADHRLAFDDLSDDVNVVVSEKNVNPFADGCRIAADGDQLPVAVRAHGDIARELQDAFRSRLE